MSVLLDRRAAIVGAGATILAPSPPARAFLPGLLARSILGFVGRTAGAGSARVGAAAVGAATQARSAQAAAAIARRPGVTPREPIYSTYGRAFAKGMGQEMGAAAGRAVVRGLSEGWGELRGRGRPRPQPVEEDDVFVAFPNAGYERPPILGCPEIFILGSMIDLMMGAFIRQRHAVDAHTATIMAFPLFGLEIPRYDDIWNSQVPTVYESERHIVRFFSSGMLTQHSHVRITIWRSEQVGMPGSVPLSSRAPELDQRVPIIE